MKRRFLSIAVIAVAVFLLSATAVSAQTWDCGASSNVGGASSVQCVLTANGTFTVSGEGAMANYSWNPPPPWYELRSSITSLVIEEGVTTIGDCAFQYHSNLTSSLTIPNSVTSIGWAAFRNCSGFTGDLVIPNSVTTIGDYAFSGCSGFTGSLTIGNSVTTIGGRAFSGCSGFTGSLTIGNSVTTIGGSAFSSCSRFTGSLNIPNSVTTIGSGAFWGCSGFTGDLIIPNSVTTIGDYAFSGCSGFTGDLIIPNSVTTIGSQAFRDCSGFTGDLVIPNSVTAIGDGAFSGCSGFTGSLVIPNSVTTIGDGAFSGCSGFTGSLVIGNSVTTIGFQAFAGCSGFTGDLTIPNSVTTIGNGAFAYCSGITSINVATNNAYYISENGVLFNKAQDTLIQCPGGKQGTYTIPNTVTTIGNRAFWGCSGLTGSLVIPNSVTTIGDGAFFGCSGFTGSLVIPNSVTYIGSNAFFGCSGFTGSLVIPNSVTTIGSQAFRDCSGFTGDLVIPNSVTAIGSMAFFPLSGVTSINVATDNINYSSQSGVLFNKAQDTLIQCPGGRQGTYRIPNTVTTIGDGAFSGCSGLTGDLVIPNTVTTIGDGAFSGCSGFTGSLVIPNSVTTIGNSAFFGCSGFTGDLVIPNSVTTIEIGAFSNCRGFTGDLVIPNSVTSIGWAAFSGCSGFTGSLVIPNSVTTIGGRAFSGCNGLGTIISQNPIPPEITSSTFENLHKIGVRLNVPESSVEQYRETEYWSEFLWVNETPSWTWECGATSNVGGAASVTATLSDGTLTISGTGAMADYISSSNIPWRNYCNLIKEVIIEEGVTTIGNSAFSYCVYMKSVTIPNSVTSIGDWAFSGCTGLTSITSLTSVPLTISDNVFSNVNKTVDGACLYVPTNIIEDYRNTEYWRDFNCIQPIDVYTVTFNSQGGSQVNPQYVLTTGNKTTRPANPARTGYTFDGWYTDLTYTAAWDFFNDIVTGDITLYAKWTLMVNAATPVISTQPSSGTVIIGADRTLSVSASVSDGGVLSYQWYSNTTASNAGGTAIDGMTSATYSPSTSVAGTFYYYVIVTNTNSSVNGNTTATVTSSVVTLTVIPTPTYTLTVQNGGLGFEGNGVYKAGDTVVISSGLPAENMRFLRWTSTGFNIPASVVNVGKTTIIMPSSNVTLTANWEAVTAARVNFTFAAGSNIVNKASLGKVAFFVSDNGASLSKSAAKLRVSGTIIIYDAMGNVVRRLNVKSSDKQVAEWDLKDNKGRLVADGTYLARGVLTVNGKREKVSAMIGVK